MKESRTSQRTTPTKGAPGKRARSAEVEVRPPIWSEVFELEQKLEPVAASYVKATTKPTPWVSISVGLALAILATVVASLEFNRRVLIFIVKSRPRVIQSPIPSFAQYQNWANLQVTWDTSLSALGSGIGGWLLVASVPRWRGFAKRFPWVPFLGGAAIYFGVMWYLTFYYVG